jgi:hypothetical protein
MNELIQRSDFSLCYRKVCAHANGKNADILTTVTALALTFVAVAVAVKYLR